MAESQKPRDPSAMTKSLRRSTLILLVVITLVLAGLYLFRLPLAGWGLRQILSHQGVVADLDVAALGHDYLLIEDLVAGPGPDLIVGALEVVFRPSEIFAGTVQTVTVSGLVLRLDLTKEAIEIAGFPIDADEGGAGSPLHEMALPTITIRDSRLLALTPLGDIEARLAADIRQEERGAIAFSSDVALTAASLGDANGSLTATLEDGNRLFGELNIEDGRLALPEAEVTGLNGHLTYQLTTDNLSSLVVDAEFQAAALALRQPNLPVSAFREARISAQIRDGSATVENRLSAEDGSLRGTTRLSLTDYWNGGPIVGDGHFRATAPSPLPAAFGLPEPDQGTLAIDVSLKGQAPGIAQATEAPDRLASQLLAQALTFNGQAELDDLSVPGWFQSGEADLSITGTLNENALTIETRGPATVTLSGLNGTRLAAAGLPDSVIPLVWEGVVLTTGTTEAPTTLVHDHGGEIAKTIIGGLIHFNILNENATFTSEVSLDLVDGQLDAFSLNDTAATVPSFPLPDGELRDIKISGNASGNLQDLTADLRLDGSALATHLGAVVVEQTDFEVPLSIHVNEAAARIVTKSGAKAELRGLSGPAGLTASGPAVLSIKELEASVPRSDQGNMEIGGHGVLNAASFQALLDDTPLGIAIAPLTLEISGSGVEKTLSVLRGRFTSESLGLSDGYVADLSGFTGRFRIDPTTLEATSSFTIAETKLAALEQVIEPFGVDGTVSRDSGSLIRFKAEPYWVDELRPLSLLGQFQPDSGIGTLSAEIAPITFSPGGLQPKAFSPLAQHFEKVGGTLTGEASLDWQGSQLASSGRFAVENGSFTSAGVDVAGLSTTVLLDSLWPVETPPGQRLTVETLDVGVPLSDLETLFAVRSGKTGAPVVTLDKSSFNMLGGKINIRPQKFDIAATNHPLAIDILRLDLGELFAFTDVEGVDGSGHLDGTIPITIAPEGIAIENGRLANVGPGRLHIRSATARAYLSNYDENVDLLMEALEDFHYETLTLDIDKTASEDLTARLSVLGNNPNVLEGHPFQLNIRLDSNIERLMRAMLEGYRISNEALRRAWGLGR